MFLQCHHFMLLMNLQNGKKTEEERWQWGKTRTHEFLVILYARREVPQWDGTCLCLKTIRRFSFRADSNWMNGWKPHQKKAGEPIRWKGTVLSCLVCILLVFCVFLYKLCETEHQNLNQETLILNASKRETVWEQKNHLRPYIKETTLVLTRNAPQTSCRPWGG